MGLGQNNEICKQTFVETMRARLEAEKSGQGASVDDPKVQANLGALGEAIYQIATVHAETVTDELTDQAFWQWVTEVSAWLTELAEWQQSVDKAFAAWAPVTPTEVALKDALTKAPHPGLPPVQVPTALKGKIR